MIDLDRALVYDIETLPNVFTLNVQGLFSDLNMTFEVSDRGRDDRASILQWFEYWRATVTPMIGFNNIGFDYPVSHFIWQNPGVSVYQIHQRAMEIIGGNRFDNQVWESDRFCPQIDLFKIHHFDNRAKTTSLKALQFAMRSDSVMEMPLPFDMPMTREQIDNVLIPYNIHDVAETKRFAHFSLKAIKFRIELLESGMVQGDVLNFNDTKIGAKYVEQQLGDDLCYTWESGRKQPRQTIRDVIALNDIIFPHVKFKHPEFSRVLAWMRTQSLHADEITERIKTKGVFTGIHATVGGVDFKFGTGGIHASVDASVWAADADHILVDIDVSGMYPANMIANRLYPEHLGDRFVEVFSGLPIERAKHKKGTAANGVFKLAGNGTFGNTNNVHSVFLDPKVTMATTINGQSLICMLAEWLLEVPTLQIIQANTDGITFRCRRDWLEHTKIIRSIWERTTRLALEEVQYSRMWIRDVNNYIAESADGKLKLKGAYWFPTTLDDISNSSPPAWHKDYSAQVVVMAAVEHMTKGTDIERFVYSHKDPFDFMCRAKVDRRSRLMIGDQEQQRITRYYVAINGAPMVKVSPPTGPMGDYKRKNGITDAEYYGVLSQIAPGAYDERIHTKNKSRYETREMGIEAGHLVAQCNRASDFSFQNVKYEWYIASARKLVIK